MIQVTAQLTAEEEADKEAEKESQTGMEKEPGLGEMGTAGQTETEQASVDARRMVIQSEGMREMELESVDAEGILSRCVGEGHTEKRSLLLPRLQLS